MKDVEVYTDGACLGNPKVGDWRATFTHSDTVKGLCGGQHITNNRMAFTAPIKALEVFQCLCKVKIFTNFQYVRKGVAEWIQNWQVKDWKTAAKKDVKNKGLRLDLPAITEQHEVEWVWVKGHSRVVGK